MRLRRSTYSHRLRCRLSVRIRDIGREKGVPVSPSDAFSARSGRRG